MFYLDSNLLELDVSKFKTGNVRDMSYMFSEVKRVTSLDISNFDTSNCENMLGMFQNLIQKM
jgi:surface protein